MMEVNTEPYLEVKSISVSWPAVLQVRQSQVQRACSLSTTIGGISRWMEQSELSKRTFNRQDANGEHITVNLPDAGRDFGKMRVIVPWWLSA